jgi:DNA-binding NarL/FixJ family response regulator
LTPGNPGEGLLSRDEWTRVAAALALTPREQQVAVLACEGKTREAIASRLQLKPRTVREHFERMYLKLHVGDRVGLVLRIIRVRDLLLLGACGRGATTARRSSTHDH